MQERFKKLYFERLVRSDALLYREDNAAAYSPPPLSHNIIIFKVLIKVSRNFRRELLFFEEGDSLIGDMPVAEPFI